MKLVFSSNGFKALSFSRICGVLFYSTETQISKPKKVKKDTLYSRIFKVGYDQNVSIVPILVQWAKVGKDFKKEELITIARNLKESKRLKHAYQEGRRKYLWIKRSEPLQNVMDEYCRSESVGIRTFRFLFDGTRIPGGKTPDQFGLEDGDMIDVFVELLGGGRATLP